MGIILQNLEFTESQEEFRQDLWHRYSVLCERGYEGSWEDFLLQAAHEYSTKITNLEEEREREEWGEDI